MKTNTEILQDMYEAFGQGNVPFILGTMSEDFTWFDPGNPAIIAHGGHRSGRDGMLQFFQELGGKTQTTQWEVDGYVAEGDIVFATGKQGITVHETGKSVLFDWVMRWVFADGRPVSGRSYYDTADVEKAFQ